MEGIRARHRSYPWLRVPVVFLIHQSLGTWGVFLAAPWVLIFLGEVGRHFGLKTYMAQTQWLLYGTPFSPAHVVFALVLGWVLGGTLRHRSMLWVWIFPFLSLCTAYIGFPLIGNGSAVAYAPLGVSSKLEYSWGYFGVHSFQQVVRISLLYSATAYSLGALLARRALRMPAFFETMRSLRKMRLIFLVGLPWLCLRFLLTWQSVSARHPELRSSAGLRFYLRGLFIVSVFLTFVFAIAVSLVGRRFLVTRFFLNPSESPRE
jgi:hypothetical protein